jgi:peptidoglycan/LPS O-acetylase OafA/YrhL
MVSAFRPEIAGLRTVAVISVVLFHLKVSGFQGGFVGVDIFFVISGYLITRNILSDLQANRFSFGQFYVRRTRRIYPALIFTVVATYLAGALWCSPEMFLDLAKECTHALLSISNVQYWRESHQYFAPNSDELALLHCWSLSLEEQFYLVWPVLIVLARKSGRTFQFIAIAAVISFLLSIFAVKTDPLAAFFLMPFRIFEFAVGALVLPLEKRFCLSDAAAEFLSVSGMVSIAGSVLLLESDMPHLDALILLPCLGAAATIWASDKARSSKIITNPAMLAVGAISYSLYLCHWPIIFFGRFIFGDAAANSFAGILTMVASMSVVAASMYLLVERRFVQPSNFRSANFLRNAAAFGSVIVALTAVTHTTFLSKGLVWRIPKAELELAHLQDYPSGRDWVPTKGPVRFELVGDSHAVQYIAGLWPLAAQLDIRFDILAAPGCPMLYGVTLKDLRRRDECQSWRDRTLQHLEQASLPIIYAQRWELYTAETADFQFEPTELAAPGEEPLAKLQLAIEKTIKEIGARRILIIGDQVKASCPINRPRLLQGPLPHAPQPPCQPTTRELAQQSTAPIDRMLARIQKKWPDRIELMRPVDYFCGSECPVVKDGIWLYFERTHFSVTGSKYMVSRAADVFREFMEK